ncbi:MAG: RNA polymerase sigma-70 factor (ECF subfamily) [Pseudoalteromonas distincta]|jgi:RNA polymerase sigma-70 factor (ECF subfamily)
MLPLSASQSPDAATSTTLQPLESSASPGVADPAIDRLGRRLAAERPAQIRFLRSRLPSLEEAEDAWQDASIKFLQHARTLQAAERPEAWMAVSLRRLVVDRYRRAAVRRRLAESLAVEPVPDAAGETEDLISPTACLTGLVAGLKPDYAQILQQAYLEEQPLKQVAERLSLTANNAAVRLHRARGALRQALSDKCQACALADCWAKARIHQITDAPARGE